MKELILAIIMAVTSMFPGNNTGNNQNNQNNTNNQNTTINSDANSTDDADTQDDSAQGDALFSTAPSMSFTSIKVPTGFDAYEIKQGAWEGKFIWKFDSDITRGAVSTSNLSDASPKVLDHEAYYGLKAYTKGSNIYVKAYNHSKAHTISESFIKRFDSKKADIYIGFDEYTCVDASSLANGPYAFVSEFDSMQVALYFYVNDGTPYCVRMDYSTRGIDRYKEINDYVASRNFTPDMALDYSDVQYPTWEGTNNRCDTSRWAQLSHDLLDAHPDWSDEMKIWCLTEWMVDNIKYDYWRYNNGSSRAMTYGVWDGTYSMWDLKVGVCCDFVNVMAIMLREQGIPVSSLNNDGHTWNIVYIDGMWNELDITNILPYGSYDFDAKDCVNRKANYSEYMTGKKFSSGYEKYGIGEDIYDSNFWN